MGDKNPQRLPSLQDGKLHNGETPRRVNIPAGAPREPKSMRHNRMEKARIQQERQARQARQQQQQAQGQAMQQQAMQQQMALHQGFVGFQGPWYNPLAGWGFMNPAFGMGVLDRAMPAIPAFDANVPNSLGHSAGADFSGPRTLSAPGTTLTGSISTSTSTTGATPIFSRSLDDPFTSNISSPFLGIRPTNVRQKPPARKEQQVQSTPPKSALQNLPTNPPTGPKTLRDMEMKSQEKTGYKAEEVEMAPKSISKGRRKRKTKKQSKENKEQREDIENRSPLKTGGRVQKESALRDEQEKDVTEKTSKDSMTNKQHDDSISLQPQIPAPIPLCDTPEANNLLLQQDNEEKLLQRQHDQQLEQLKLGKFYRKDYLKAGGSHRKWLIDRMDMQVWMTEKHEKERAKLENDQKNARDTAFGLTDPSSPLGNATVRNAMGQSQVHDSLPLGPSPGKNTARETEDPKDIRELRSMTKEEFPARQARELDESCKGIVSENTEKEVDEQDAAAEVAVMERKHSGERQEWNAVHGETESKGKDDQGSKRKRSDSVQSAELSSEQRKYPRVDDASTTSKIGTSSVVPSEDFVDEVKEQAQSTTHVGAFESSGIKDGEWIGDGLMSLLG